VLGTARALTTAPSPVLYSDGLYHDPAKEPELHRFIASYNLRRLEEVISSLRWENFRLKEALLQ